MMDTETIDSPPKEAKLTPFEEVCIAAFAHASRESQSDYKEDRRYAEEIHANVKLAEEQHAALLADAERLRGQMFAAGRLLWHELDEQQISNLARDLIRDSGVCPNCYGEGIDGEPSDGIVPGVQFACDQCGGSGKAGSQAPAAIRPATGEEGA